MNTVTIPDAVFEYCYCYCYSAKKVSVAQIQEAWRVWYEQEGFVVDPATNLLSKDGVLYIINVDKRQLVEHAGG